ncbi:MAG: TIGR00341 family protein [Lachnospirales bacterium]
MHKFNDVINYIYSNLQHLKKDQLETKDIVKNMVHSTQIKGSPLFILFCAIIVASVGLNTNSTAVIIGAMLISPLMSPIIAIAFSLAIYNVKLLKSSTKIFLIQVLIALAGSFIYFLVSPIKTETSEILARTSPNFFDIIIALFGGFAGIIGITRKEKTNVIPGVAIATALMPPMCVVGFGLAHREWSITLGAAYLFIINVFFIMLSAFLFCKFHRSIFTRTNNPEYDRKVKHYIIIAICAITIPCFISAYLISSKSIAKNTLDSNINNFIASEIETDNLAVMNIVIHESYIRLNLIGAKLDNEEILYLEESLPNYGLENYNLVIVQDLEKSLFEFFKGKSPYIRYIQ